MKTPMFGAGFALLWAVFGCRAAQAVPAPISFERVAVIPGAGVGGAALLDPGGGRPLEVFLSGEPSRIASEDKSGRWRATPLPAAANDAAAVLAVDINHDGRPDLVVGGRHGLRALLNEGDGHFRAVVLPGGDAPVRSVAAGDINHDGWIDLYVVLDDGSGHLWRNRGRLSKDGVPEFVDVTAAAGARGCCAVTGALLADFNGDGNPDLLLMHRDAPPELLANRGAGSFVRAAVLGHGGEWRGVAAADYDGDGRLDVLLYGAEGMRLMRNEGGWRFRDVTAEAGLPGYLAVVAARWTDAADQGQPDLVVLTPAPMGESGLRCFWHTDRGHFGEGACPVHPSGRARFFSIGDIDGNGLPDWVIGGARGGVEIWRNRGAGNHWLGLELAGYHGATTLGSRIVVRAGDGRRILRQVYAAADGGDFPARIRIGLGASARQDSVTLHWSSGMVTRVKRPALDAYLRLVEPQPRSAASGGQGRHSAAGAAVFPAGGTSTARH